MKKYEISCLECSKQFISKYKTKKYCSALCQNRAARKRRKEKFKTIEDWRKCHANYQRKYYQSLNKEERQKIIKRVQNRNNKIKLEKFLK